MRFYFVVQNIVVDFLGGKLLQLGSSIINHFPPQLFQREIYLGGDDRLDECLNFNIDVFAPCQKIRFPDIFAKGVVFFWSPTIDCEILIQTKKNVKLRNVQGANLSALNMFWRIHACMMVAVRLYDVRFLLYIHSTQKIPHYLPLTCYWYLKNSVLALMNPFHSSHVLRCFSPSAKHKSMWIMRKLKI